MDGQLFTQFFTVTPLTYLMGGLILLVSGVVASFSTRYMDGDARKGPFFFWLAVLTLDVLVLVAADHVVVFALAWFIMGQCLASLIGHVKSWPAARASARMSRTYFLVGSVLLAAALGLMAMSTGEITVSAMTADLSALSGVTLYAVAGMVLLAAMIQSGLVPFHKWLLGSLTAPTPVSAFMHAGIVNAGGFLIIRLHPLFTADSRLLLIVFAAGAVSAFLGALWMLVQSDIKRQLACSTVSQMGFMILQCGLGFYTAALAHLILHGFYKAYLFLSAGSALEGAKVPGSSLPSSGIGLVKIGLIVLGGVLAAEIFAVFTAKSVVALNSAGVLVCFVLLAGMKAMKGFMAMDSLSRVMRAMLGFAVIAVTAGLYTLIYNQISVLLPINESQPLSLVHIVSLLVFFASWIYALAGLLKHTDKLYMFALNSSQPPPATITEKRSSYHA